MAYTGSLNDKYYSTKKTTSTGSNLTDRGYPSSTSGYKPTSAAGTGGYYQALQNAGKVGSAPATRGTDANKQVWTSMNGYVNASGTNAYNPGSSSTSKVSSSGSGSGSSSSSDAYASLLSAYISNAQRAAEEQLAAQRAAAQNAYNNGMNALNNAYNSRIGNLRSNYDSTVGQLNDSYNNSAGKINANSDNALREAYINRMISEKNLQQNLAAQGLSGGATESSMASLLNNYGNSRNNIENTKASNLSELAYTLNNNLANALQNYNSAVADADATKASQIMNLENALANNQIGAVQDYYSALNANNDNYMSLLKSLVSNMGKYNMTPAQVTNLVNSVNTKQGSMDANSNYAKLLASYTNGGGDNSNVALGGTDTLGNANLLAQMIAQING